MILHTLPIHHAPALAMMASGLVVGIAPLIAGAIVGGLMKGIGSLIGSHQKNAQEDAAYKQTLYKYNNWAESDKLRRNLITGLAKAHGVESLLPPGALESFSHRVYTPPPQGYKQSALGAFAGGAFGGAADQLARPGNPADLTHASPDGGGGGGGGDEFGTVGPQPETPGGSLVQSMGGLGSGNMGAASSPFKIKGLPSNWGAPPNG